MLSTCHSITAPPPSPKVNDPPYDPTLSYHYRMSINNTTINRTTTVVLLLPLLLLPAAITTINTTNTTGTIQRNVRGYIQASIVANG